MTVYDALKRASAQMYGGEAQTDDLEDDEIFQLYMQYAQEGFARIWAQMDPLDVQALPDMVRLPCPALTRDTELGIYPARAYDALCDYVTWRVCGTGNAVKQQRGEWYYARYMENLTRIPKDASWDSYYESQGAGMGRTQFYNVYNY